MTKQHIKFPSIEQFRTVIKYVKDTCNYHTIPAPKLKFRGTVKLHGTNASVVLTPDEIWAQSREHIISPLKDNAGFAQYVHTRESMWREVDEAICQAAGLTSGETISVYGEWCGAGIQKGVGISGIPKMFVIFGIRVGTEDSTAWLPKAVHDQVFAAMADTFKANQVFSIFDFQTWEIEIDFSNPEAVQNTLGGITIGVEDECPVALAFGIKKGVGEGVVWTCIDEDTRFSSRGLLFKVKGEKHSVSKVKTLAAVDVEKVNNVIAFVDKVVTENRLIQMKQKVVEAGLDGDDIKNIGAFLKLLGNDVIKEELDTLEASGLVTKDVMSKVNARGKDWYIANIGKEV